MLGCLTHHQLNGRSDYIGAMHQLTQNALVTNVPTVLLKPGFLPGGVTRLYTVSRNQTYCKGRVWYHVTR